LGMNEPRTAVRGI